MTAWNSGPTPGPYLNAIAGAYDSVITNKSCDDEPLLVALLSHGNPQSKANAALLAKSWDMAQLIKAAVPEITEMMRILGVADEQIDCPLEASFLGGLVRMRADIERIEKMKSI